GDRRWQSPASSPAMAQAPWLQPSEILGGPGCPIACRQCPSGGHSRRERAGRTKPVAQARLRPRNALSRLRAAESEPSPLSKAQPTFGRESRSERTAQADRLRHCQTVLKPEKDSRRCALGLRDPAPREGARCL